MQRSEISRRKFIATSSNVISAIAAYTLQPGLHASTVAAQDRSSDASLASIDAISPSGMIEYRVTGNAEQRFFDIPVQIRHREYEALLGHTDRLASIQNQFSTLAYHAFVTRRVSSRISGLQHDGLRYTNYDLQTQLEGVWASAETATVIWTECVRFAIAGDPDPRAPQSYSEVITHCTLLKRDGSDWRIILDDPTFGTESFRTGQEIPIVDPPARLDRGQRTPQDLLERTLAAPTTHHPASAASSPQTTNHNVYLPIITNGVSQTYSREAATAYALAHGDAPPDDENGYHVFNNNCMNFVSQCLKAGGWPQVLGFYKSTDAWWHTGDWPFYASYPWINSHYWYNFTLNSKRGERIYNIWDLWFGDVLQFSWHNTNIMDHTAIVSFRSNSGIIYIAQHTVNYSHRPLTDMVADIAVKEPQCVYYPWRMEVVF